MEGNENLYLSKKFSECFIFRKKVIFLWFFLTISSSTRAGAEGYYRRESSDAALWGSFVAENQPRESCSPQCEP